MSSLPSKGKSQEKNLLTKHYVLRRCRQFQRSRQSNGALKDGYVYAIVAFANNLDRKRHPRFFVAYLNRIPGLDSFNDMTRGDKVVFAIMVDFKNSTLRVLPFDLESSMHNISSNHSRM